MNKNKIIKYVLISLIIILLVIATIFGIVKIIKSKQNANVSDVENGNSQEEQDGTIEVNTNEAEIEENTPEKEEPEPVVEAQPPKQNDIPYYIKINYTQNVVTIYSKDSQGNYTIPVKAMVCSCGTATPTSGVYTTSDKYKWGVLVGGVCGQYCTRIVKSILFHSVPYLTYGDKGSLEYWEYDKLGTTASAGCIRLTVEDALWIYNNCVAGTQVEFYSDPNPGPLGKPTAQKISEDEAVRGWDPTDPDTKNPWKTYVKLEVPSETPIVIPEENIPEVPTTPEVETEIEQPIPPEEEKDVEDEKIEEPLTNKEEFRS